MSLLTKAKVITTPTAYSDGILHSVKPNVVLGDELITNGDFSQSGTATTSSYSLGWYSPDLNDVVISSGVMTIYNVGGSGGRAYATDGSASINIVTSGKQYRLTYTVVENNGVSSLLYHNGGAYVSAPFTLGTHTIDYIAGGSIFLLRNNSTGTNIVLDNVSVKAKLDADFTFTRNSSATRVGEDGYIQDVQIIGSELVQNGDFEEIGSEEITNGSFDTDSDWTKFAGATISNGKGNIIGDGSSFTNLTQSNVFTVGKFYKVSLDAVINSGLGLKVQDGSTNENFGAITTSGTYTFYGKANNASLVIGRRTGGTAFDSYIDNVSVKEVGQNWTFTSGATIDDGEVVLSPSANISQNCGLVSGKKYRIKYDITSIDAGGSGVTVYAGSTGAGTTRTQVGTYTEDIVSSGIQTLYFFTGGSFVSGSIDNISVKEVTDDTNLPRINYEGGKGHLLLEGQSTNLFPYSEDFSQSDWSKLNVSITSNATISPDGTQNASLIYPNATSSGATYINDSISSTNSIYSISAFFKANGKNVAWLYIQSSSTYGIVYFDLSDQSIEVVAGSASTPTGTINDMGNGWYKVTLTTGSSLTLFTGSGIGVCDAKGSFSVTKNGTDGVYIYGLQIEQGNISSYIPTNGSAVTRAAETCNNATQSFPSEGVLYAEIAALANDGTTRRLSISNGSYTERVAIGYTSSNNQIQAFTTSGGSTQSNLTFTLTDATEFNKIAIRYKENDCSMWVNGELKTTDLVSVAPSGLIELAFDDGAGNVPFYGKTKMVATFPYLSNDEMECLTGEGYGSFEAMALANNYTII